MASSTINVTFFAPNGQRSYNSVESIQHVKDGVVVKYTYTLSDGHTKQTTTITSTLPYLIEEFIEHDGTITL